MSESMIQQDRAMYGSPDRGFVMPVCARVHIGMVAVLPEEDEDTPNYSAEDATLEATLIHGSCGPTGTREWRLARQRLGIKDDYLEFPSDLPVPSISNAPITYTSEVYVEMRLRNLAAQMQGFVTSHFYETCPVQDICDSPLNPQR